MRIINRGRGSRCPNPQLAYRTWSIVFEQGENQRLEINPYDLGRPSRGLREDNPTGTGEYGLLPECDARAIWFSGAPGTGVTHVAGPRVAGSRVYPAAAPDVAACRTGPSTLADKRNEHGLKNP